MQSDYYINLHFNQAVAQRTGYAFKIGDKGCTFHLHCEDLDPSGMFPHIVFNHPNNTCVEGVPSGSGRDYTYTIAGNEFGVCGKTVVDLKFYNDNLEATQRISTASFMIEIIPDTYTDFEESSSSYADSLERAREEIDAAIIELQGAERDLDDMSGQFADTLQDYIDAFGNTAPINPCGAYDAATEYHPRDAVTYTVSSKELTYINRRTCTGIAPNDPDDGATYWQVLIDVSGSGAFSALSDVAVDTQTLANDQVPAYNSTTQKWENKTILENSLTSTSTDKALTAAKGKDLQDNKQPKELLTSISIKGENITTVETALGALKNYSDDISTIKATGSTNNTGATINKGEFFYLNGTFCKALADIAAAASFTDGTNYEESTTGEEISGLNGKKVFSFVTEGVAWNDDTRSIEDISGYKFLDIVFSYSDAVNYLTSVSVPIEYNKKIPLDLSFVDSSQMYHVLRTISFTSSTTMSVDKGFYIYNGSPIESNYHCIVRYIFAHN